MEVRNAFLGPLSPDLNIMQLLHERMGLLIPADAHLHCDGKLNISVTRYDNGENVLLNRFDSKEELLQALMCSVFIPVYCGYKPPVFRGVAYVDAAFSNNSPRLDEDTITVAPFSGKSDICPESDGWLLRSFTLSNTSVGFTAKNMYKLFRVLFPASADGQRELAQKGYNDALRFLRDNGLIQCPDCSSSKNSKHKYCKPLQHPMQDTVHEEFGAAIQKYEQNLGYRLLRFKSMKMLYYMNIPSIFTAKVTYIILAAILQKVHSKAGSCVDDLWSHFLQLIKDGVHKQPYTKMQCHDDNNIDMKNAICDTNDPYTTNYHYTMVQCEDESTSDDNSESSVESSKPTITVPQRTRNYIKSAKIHKVPYSLCDTDNEDQMADVFNSYIY